MRTLLFVARWAWVAVIVGTLVIGVHFLRTVSAYEESALLTTHIGEMREFERRMLRSGVSEWLLGTTTDDPPAQIADEVDDYVATMLAAHGLRVDGVPRGDDFAAGVIASMTAAAEELRTLSQISAEEPDAEEVEALGALLGANPGADAPASLFSELASDPQQLVVPYGALSYTATSQQITRHLDRVATLATQESDAHFAELRRAGEVAIGFLLVGGVLAAIGYAWTGHRTRRDRWEVERARQRAKLGGEFVSLASHELRTPLVGIYGFSELLLDEEALPPRARDWVERIHKESARLTRIVEDLLDVSRIESGRMEVRRERVAFAAVVDSVYATFEGMSARHPLRIRGDLDAEVVGDQDKLIEVLSNLVDNAIKYSVDGDWW